MSDSRVTEGRGKLYSSILDTIGNTPCVQVKKIAPDPTKGSTNLLPFTKYFFISSAILDLPPAHFKNAFIPSPDFKIP